MELFKDTHFNFAGKKWWFILSSLVILLAGAASLLMKHGPRYGIEFRGGAVMDVLWEGTPPIERIRAAVSERVNGASVLAAHDLSGSNEVLVSVQPPSGGDLTSVREAIREALASTGANFSIRSFEVIGPEVGADLRRQALLATGGASGGMLLYLGWRFRFRYGVGAVIAMLHDAFITLGLFSLLDQEISLTVVAAFLTLIGYSMNDTIVVFDRIRENLRMGTREPFTDTVNRSINQTLSRTVLTSGLTLITALSLLFFGGPVLRGFSLALVIGIVVGTFSSIFVASPILLAWENAATRWAESRISPETRGAQ
jgi:preprotein translocase subunit SecF